MPQFLKELLEAAVESTTTNPPQPFLSQFSRLLPLLGNIEFTQMQIESTRSVKCHSSSKILGSQIQSPPGPQQFQPKADPATVDQVLQAANRSNWITSPHTYPPGTQYHPKANPTQSYPPGSTQQVFHRHEPRVGEGEQQHQNPLNPTFPGLSSKR